jgi:glycosyltransferase involved in cell wall biosynthesis
MIIVNLSYVKAADATEPRRWLQQIRFYTGIVECVAQSNEVHSIHCIGYSDVFKERGVNYHFFTLTFIQRLFPFGLHRYIKHLNPDVVIVHGLHFPFQVMHLQTVLDRNCRIFVQHHAEKPFSGFRRLLQKRIDRFVRGYFFTSRSLASPFLNAGIISSPQKVIEVMEATSGFQVKDRDTARRKLNITNELVYTWVGRLDENKDPISLLNAFLPFARERPNILLNLIFKDDKLLREVKHLLADGPTNIKLIGKVKHVDLEDWYNASDFIVSTSHYEGSGISVCEGISCGCIPILTDIPSFQAMTNDRSIGLFFKPGDHESLLQVLKQSIVIDREVERRKVIDQFNAHLSPASIVQKMLKALTSTS